MRCGFAATSSTDRVGAAASYYGVMEMAGNVSEMCVTVGNSYGRAFTGDHGNGALSVVGFADVVGWPQNDGIGDIGHGTKGGDWSNDVTGYYQLRISDRSLAATRIDYNKSRYNDVGVRLVSGARGSQEPE